jgi:hypothetical protein
MKNQFWEKLAVVTVILSERAFKREEKLGKSA